MADESDIAKGSPKKRVRSPAYPAFGLGRAVDYAAALYDAEHKHAAAPGVAARALGFTDERSGPASSALSALKKFGLLLVDEKGHVQLSPWALDIVLAPAPDHPARLKALREAALAPIIYRELWEKWNGRLPSDQNIAYYLERERNFNPNVIPAFIQDLRSTLEFAGLVSGFGEDGGQSDEGTGTGGGKESAQRRPMQPGMKEAVLPLTEGDVIVRYPERISTQSFEDLEDWMQLMIRRMKRAVTSGNTRPNPDEPADQ